MDTNESVNKKLDGCPILIHTELHRFETNCRTYLDKNTIIIGQRGSGKTLLALYEIYGKVQGNIDELCLICPKLSHCMDEYSKYIDKIYNIEDLASNVSINRTSGRKYMIIIDGCDYYINNKMIEELIMCNSNMDTTIVVLLQSSILNIYTRDKIHNVLVAHEYNNTQIKRMYEHYFGIFPKLNMFRDIIQHLSSYEFLFANNISDSINIQDRVGYIKSNMDVKLEEKSKNLNNDTGLLIISNQNNAELIGRISACIDELIDIRNQLKREYK